MRGRYLVFILFPALIAGCTKSHSLYFQGELVESRPGGESVKIPVLIEREIVSSQNKLIISNHQTTNGATHHFATVYDFNSHKLEMQENGSVLSTGTFSCEPGGNELDTLTSCTYDIQTGRGDTIHGTDTYQGAQSIVFDTVLTVKSDNRQFKYSGGAFAISEADFKSALKRMFPAGGGCQIDFQNPHSAGWVSLAVCCLGPTLLRVLASRRRRRAATR